jgi:hypothetical protein
MKHAHTWKLVEIGSLGKQYECKCGKTTIRYDIHLPVNMKKIFTIRKKKRSKGPQFKFQS